MPILRGTLTGLLPLNVVTGYANRGTEFADTLDDLNTSSDGIYDPGSDNTINALGGDDVVRIHNGNDTVNGGEGDDQIYDFGTGNDVMNGDGGNDFFYVGLGNDTVNGGTGIDTVFYGYSQQSVFVSLNSGSAHLPETSSQVILIEEDLISIENAYGSAYNDRLFGSSVENSLWGREGDDWIEGGDGNDRIIGGRGQDDMYGGYGFDTFIFTSIADAEPLGTGFTDAIWDFSNYDKIDLSAIDANVYLAGDQAFTYIGTSGFTGVAGQLHFINPHSRNSFVEGDVNGDCVADFQILVPLDPTNQTDVDASGAAFFLL
jgi:Ca2+-binding RTX toxin-like protein